MASDHVSEASTQRVGESYKREPQATFTVHWFYDLLIFVFEVEKALASLGVGYERILPFMKDTVAFFLLAE